MYISKTSPISEDAWIDRLVKSLESQLLSVWDVLTTEVKFYGRCETIDGNDYWYSNGNNVDVLMDNSLKFISYVKTSPEIEYRNHLHHVNANLVCQGNLSKLYPTITHRADAELRRDVRKVLFGRLDNEYNYLGFSIIDQSKKKDMQPYHTFELNFVITY